MSRAIWLLLLLGAPHEPARLERVLEHLGRTASLYRDQALRFTCDETITYTDALDTRRFRFRYIYVRSEAGALDDHREPKGWRTARRWAADERAALVEMGFPLVLVRPYSWIFVFEPGLRERFRFALDGEETVLGRPALRIVFEALPPIVRDENEWTGVAWVDREDYQLLRVEAYHVLETITRNTRFTTDFGIVESGMRFPSRVIVDSVRPSFEITQAYRQYRFFAVRTAEEVRRLVIEGGTEH